MPINDLPNWVKYLSAFLTIVLSIIATLIIILQFLLQKDRWRLNLFEKRYKVYDDTMKFITTIVQKVNLNDDELYSFLRQTKDRDFLFGKEIREFLDEVYNKGNDLIYVIKKMEDVPVGKERDKLADQEMHLSKWFSQQYETSKKLFGEYLTIDKK